MYPHERSLVKKYANQPFAIVGVNSDPKERVQKVMKEGTVLWRSFWDGGATGGPIARAWNVSGWPTIYVIDHEGVIRYKNVRGAELDKAIEVLMAELR